MPQPLDAPEAAGLHGPPSDAWLQGGGWIGTCHIFTFALSTSKPCLVDGASNPPQFSVRQEEMNADCITASYPPLPPFGLTGPPSSAPAPALVVPAAEDATVQPLFCVWYVLTPSLA